MIVRGWRVGRRLCLGWVGRVLRGPLLEGERWN